MARARAPLMAVRLDTLREILPLLVVGPVRRRDILRASKDQILAAWDALCAVTDPEWVESIENRGEAAEEDLGPLGVADLAFSMCRELSGAYTVGDLLRLPVAEFYSLAESWRHLHNIAEGRPADADAATKRDAENLRKRLAWLESVGVRVH